MTSASAASHPCAFECVAAGRPVAPRRGLRYHPPMTTPAHIHAVDRFGPGEAAPAAPDRLVSGSAASTVWNAFTDASGRFHVGHWRAEPGVRAVRYDETELCLILEGRVLLQGPDGAAEFGPGEAFVVEAGFVGTWECIGRVTKIYAVLEP